MTLRLTDEKMVRIINHDEYDLPTETEKNVAGVALSAILDVLEDNVGFEIEVTKHIKPGSGVGSSSASAVGAVVAANKLLEERFSRLELAEFALKGEFLASQGRHADNVAPCLYGGFTLVRSVSPLDIVKIDFPKLFVTVIHPQIEIKTSEARKILPTEIPLRSAIQAWANVGALIAALSKGDYDLISRSLEDLIVEPVRKSLIPHFDELKTASLKVNALGGGISGSGPSVFMLSETFETAQSVEKAMREVYGNTKIEFNTYVSEINSEGVKILDK
ncbi:homoserine kinase [Biomphalaria pfeifferi]|uniref:Homoserine kinase n=1 Tax=Biomphalaria pfeifferi TaxID=112525 RepID=A0AAD8EUF7_BIOPF|nr:homoserine kinase [Biomphalaria pfeifferi]